MSVHVQTSAGTPIEGVTVSVDGKGWSGVTDANGNFDFGEVTPDTYTVTGQKDSYSPSSGGGASTPTSQSLNVPAGASIVFQLSLDPLVVPLQARMAVHVQKPDGTPIQGVTVSVDGKGWKGVTDAAGNFDFQEVPPGTYTVLGGKDGYGTLPPITSTASQTQDVPPAASVQYTLVLQPLCFARLKYRPVDDWKAKAYGATHSFWYVRGSDGTEYIISGGPKGEVQKLDVWKDPDLNRAGRPDKVTDPTWWETDTSFSNCAGVDNLIGAADSWPQDTISYSWSGPNSNSAAHKLGVAGGFSPSRPDGAVGWDDAIPTP
jgi:hypothetical protein